MMGRRRVAPCARRRRHSARPLTPGSSMSMTARSHVCGAAALYLQATGASPSTIRNALVNNATTNVISGAGSGSPNRLLYTLFF